MSLILASASPRRLQLLECAAIQIKEVRPSHIPEVRGKDESPMEYCQRLAFEKATSIQESGHWILAADTIVCLDKDVFEKPKDVDDAFRILRRLSFEWHNVVSAWCLRYSPKAHEKEVLVTGHAVSEVLFRELQDNEIWAYIQTGECSDKAGAYGIQGLGACLVQEIKGSYSNIVGLPLADVLSALRQYGVVPCP